MNRQAAPSTDVWASPEFKAFAERFGIQHLLKTRSLIIELSHDSMMLVKQEYFGEEVDPDVKRQ